jgi:glycosyltransferase involved in cell wall biosynthesis
MPDAFGPVSVVMPVRNAMPFLDAAIESILAQTHQDFELILGDDASTDGSGECLEEWARRDRRIRLLRHAGAAFGPAGSANWVTSAARNRLIARMDADDISAPGRLRAQVQTFQCNPDAVIVGGLSELIDAAGRRVAGRDRSIFRNRRCIFPCSHGSLMFRREIFERVGGYRRECDYWEDVDLFLRMEREGRVLILPEVLYRYRFSPTSSRRVSDEARVTRALDLSTRCLAAYAEDRDYEGLISESLRSPPVETVSLSVVVLVALEKLWRGRPRAVFQSWAWRHASFESRRHRLRIMIFFAWLWLNPYSLRAMFKLKTRFADWRARHHVTDGSVHVWRDGARRHGRPAVRPHGSVPIIGQGATPVEALPAVAAQLVATAGAERLHEQA